jgi:hypothetical protein
MREYSFSEMMMIPSEVEAFEAIDNLSEEKAKDHLKKLWILFMNQKRRSRAEGKGIVIGDRVELVTSHGKEYGIIFEVKEDEGNQRKCRVKFDGCDEACGQWFYEWALTIIRRRR